MRYDGIVNWNYSLSTGLFAVEKVMVQRPSMRVNSFPQFLLSLILQPSAHKLSISSLFYVQACFIEVVIILNPFHSQLLLCPRFIYTLCNKFSLRAYFQEQEMLILLESYFHKFSWEVFLVFVYSLKLLQRSCIFNRKPLLCRIAAIWKIWASNQPFCYQLSYRVHIFVALFLDLILN